VKWWKKAILLVVAGPTLLVGGVLLGGLGSEAVVSVAADAFPALAPLKGSVSQFFAAVGGIGLPYLIFREGD